MTFQCYLPRTSQHPVIGAVFVTAGGAHRLIPDYWLVEAELSEEGRLLRLVYACCRVEVAGQRLDPLFDDVIAARLGTIRQGPPMRVPSDQPWVSSLVVIAAAEAIRHSGRG